MAQRSGWEARVKINGVFYAVARWRFDSSCPDLDVTNSEGVPGNEAAAAQASPGRSASVDGVSKATFSLTSATFDDDDNPFAAPLSLDEGDYVSVEGFPAGAAGVSWNLVNAMITRVSQDGDVKGLSPITIDGVSDGFYELPAA